MPENTLDMETLDNIKAFSGDESPAERMMSQGMAIQQVKTSYTTAMAVQKARSISKVALNVLEEAKLAGSSFYYYWEVFDKEKKRNVPIQGGSIDLAMCVARNYGNCVVDAEVSETTTHFIFKGTLIDLETGFTCPRLFRQRKSQSLGGKMDSARQEDIVFQIGQSKAIRNAIVRAMPSWLLDKAIETAKQAELDKIKPENIHISRTKALDFFAKYGINCERIEAERKRKIDEWTAQDIVDLKGMATALQEGRISPDELFPPVEEKIPPVTEDKQEKTKRKAATPKEPTIKDQIQERLGIYFAGDVDAADKFLDYKTNKKTVDSLTDKEAEEFLNCLIEVMGS